MRCLSANTPFHPVDLGRGKSVSKLEVTGSSMVVAERHANFIGHSQEQPTATQCRLRVGYERHGLVGPEIRPFLTIAAVLPVARVVALPIPSHPPACQSLASDSKIRLLCLFLCD